MKSGTKAAAIKLIVLADHTQPLETKYELLPSDFCDTTAQGLRN